LTTLAAGFTKYLEYDPGAKLTLSAYADERGPNSYNQGLSERRLQRVKEFLVSQGITEDKIDASAFGDAKQLEKSTVIELQTQNPEQPPETRVQNFRATWLAYNRRVDVVLLPTNRESLKFYPNASPDSQILWQRAKPALSAVQQSE
jgi:outer membrane protein OmpA-like peptidoglycan-associated protein